jgi:hypothetical protein
MDTVIDRNLAKKAQTSFLHYPDYTSSGLRSTVGCNGVTRSISMPSSSPWSSKRSISVGTAGAGVGTGTSNSRSAASRAVDAASSVRNLQQTTTSQRMLNRRA